MLDLNDAEPQRSSDLIPDGSFAKVSMVLRPGGVDGPNPMDAGLLKASSQPGSDVLSLDCEFTVVEGPHVRRKFWQQLTISGGKVDEKGVSLGWSITKRTIRGMIESALGINPKDESPEAQAKRTLPSLKSLDGIVFIAKVRVKPGNDGYDGQNQLDIAVTPDMPEWDKVMKGEDVPPRPGQRRAAKVNPPANTTPAWQTGGPAASRPAATQAQTPAAAAPAWQQAQPNVKVAPAAHVAPQRAGPAWLNE